jgi:hypothetical protein
MMTTGCLRPQHWLRAHVSRAAGFAVTFGAAAAGANTAFEVCFHATAAIIVNVPKWAERNPQQAAKR